MLENKLFNLYFKKIQNLLLIQCWVLSPYVLCKLYTIIYIYIYIYIYILFFKLNMKTNIAFTLILATVWTASVIKNSLRDWLRYKSTTQYHNEKSLQKWSEKDKNLKSNKFKKNMIFFFEIFLKQTFLLIPILIKQFCQIDWFLVIQVLVQYQALAQLPSSKENFYLFWFNI